MARQIYLNRGPAISVLITLAMLLAAPTAKAKTVSDTVERWGIFELSLSGPSGGNPFVDVELSAEFEQKGRVFKP